MKHLARFVPVVVVVMLVLSMPMVAFAQDPLCSGLSDADCETVLAALETISTVESFTVPSWEFSFEMNAEGEDIMLSGAGSAGFVIADDVADSIVHIKVDSLEVVPEDPSLPSMVEVIVADGFGYINYDGEWYGEELSESDLEELDSMLMSVDSAGVAGMDESLGIDMTGVITSTREPDEEMHGQTVSVYSMDVDLMTLIINLLSSPMVGEMLGGEMGMGEMSPEELQMMGMMFAPILGDTSIVAYLAAGQDDGYIHELGVDVVIDIDLSMLGEETEPITGLVHFGAEVTDVDAGYSVDVPAEYGSMDDLQEKLDGLELDALDGLGGLGF